MAPRNQLIDYSLDGLKELDRGLAELNRATARNVARRSLRKAGQIIADDAAIRAPDDPATPAPDLHSSIVVSTKITDKRGLKEWGEEMRRSGNREKAVARLRAARRYTTGNPVVMVFVGVASIAAKLARGRENPARYAHLVHFGTVHSRAFPFMAQAWEANKMAAFRAIAVELGKEIKKAAARAARKAARLKAGK